MVAKTASASPVSSYSSPSLGSWLSPSYLSLGLRKFFRKSLKRLVPSSASSSSNKTSASIASALMERYTHAIGRKPQPMSSCWTLAKVKLNDFQNFRLLGLDPSQLLYHILLNFVTVHVTNHLLMATVCQDQLLACCDPCNWSWTSYVPMCVWLWGHFFAYMQAGYTYGRKSYSNHINLLICQVAWFYSEYYSYMSVYEKEVKDFHSHPEFGRNVKALPCDNVVYYSTWVPIWEDYIYNTLGQFAGYLLFCYVEKRRQQPSSLSLPLYHEHDYQSSSPPAKDLLNGFSKKSSGLRNVVVEGNNSVGGDIMVRAKAAIMDPPARNPQVLRAITAAAIATGAKKEMVSRPTTARLPPLKNCRGSTDKDTMLTTWWRTTEPSILEPTLPTSPRGSQVLRAGFLVFSHGAVELVRHKGDMV
eukprot:CAMPEP_0114496028 /NCGR_PEP_ID=MMETSP0109-20121206/5546_1 /TAXON_ID=29199 /ORGANISM="Chlorarachnion reptans, Strain CCCM449" /LENGTH=416 /DNA_ID=CAMNT_0001673263 /DNA_START=159 /DNA_END=1410 /DNA_ORIENTATION=+